MVVLVTFLSRKLQYLLIPGILIVGASMFAISSANAGVNDSNDCLAPVFTNYPPAIVNTSHCSVYMFDFNATEGGNTPTADPVTFATSVGSINSATGQLSIPALGTCGTTQVMVTATNLCGASTDYNFEIVWFNATPYFWMPLTMPLHCPTGELSSYDFNVVDTDPCDAAYWSITPLDAVVNAPSISPFGRFDWLSDSSEAGLTKSFRAIVADPCGAADSVVFSVEVLAHVPQIFAIEKVHGSLLGSVQEVRITHELGTAPIGGFTFLVAFDTPPLSFMSAEPGAGLLGCGWEYFTFNYIPTVENCHFDCPVSLVRITAIGDLVEIGGVPSCGQFGQGMELARLKFYVTLDRYFECQSMPVRFAWLDCSDNTAMSTNSDTLWISERVFDIQNFDPFNDPNFEITDLTCHDSVSFGGACSDCEVFSPIPTVRDIYFLNGYIDNACDGFPSAGDLNLNGISFEIADATVFAGYFLYGFAALDPDPGRRNEQIAQSDTNQDGVPFSPGDLAYLLRVIVGDASPYPKLQPFSSSAQVKVLGGNVSFESADSISVAFMTFDITGEVRVTNHSDLQLNYAERGGKLRVLLWPGIDNMYNSLPAGLNEVLDVEGAVLESATLSDYDGNVMVVDITKRSLPTQFALTQNYPNPFNPATRINIELPYASDWKLEIFNVSGQHIKSWNGRGVGIVSVDWDASGQPSGVYFYRVTSGTFVDTKKMVLLK